MNRDEAIEALRIERECVCRDCDRECGKCDLAQERCWLLEAYDSAIELLGHAGMEPAEKDGTTREEVTPMMIHVQKLARVQGYMAAMSALAECAASTTADTSRIRDVSWDADRALESCITFLIGQEQEIKQLRQECLAMSKKLALVTLQDPEEDDGK